MPYIKCPSCTHVGYAPPVRRELDLCPSCGDPLGFPRTVVTVSRGPEARRQRRTAGTRSLARRGPITRMA